ncbi:hypothetical protein F4802DRAFT_593113 [Xylaria palmicola]|nr:hypothetical protein F4802DRAFT_593113 [Xylaria palmicola]
MERPLVCTSLRKRRAWAGLVHSLLQSNSPCGRWKETQIDTHDVAIPLPARRVFRAIFVSPQDAGAGESLARIERLYNVNGGRDSGIVFLLKQDGHQGSAVSALMTLQLQLVGNWELPIIPVESAAAVAASLATLQRQLASPAANQKNPSPASSLLPFCSDGEPLADHTVNVLTDTTSGLRDLLGKVSSSAEFESEIAPLLGRDAEKMRRFWAEDHLVN